MVTIRDKDDTLKHFAIDNDFVKFVQKLFWEREYETDLKPITNFKDAQEYLDLYCTDWEFLTHVY